MAAVGACALRLGGGSVKKIKGVSFLFLIYSLPILDGLSYFPRAAIVTVCFALPKFCASNFLEISQLILDLKIKTEQIIHLYWEETVLDLYYVA